jgi:glutamate N-acetyltransferase/amino-acid N-acetyltransferase
MTTDTKPKYSFKELKSGVRILGVAKGAGMIEPNLATTLCFLFTDAQIKKGTFKVILKRALNLSFNRISVDGEQSTNDTFIALANGASGIDVEQEERMLAEFEEAVFSLLSELSYKVVEDGEGATKVIRIDVVGAKDKRSAEVIAKRLASSVLLKASLFGSCANWGRILSAIGSLKLGIGRALDVYYGDIQVVKNGVSLHIRKKEADRYLRKSKFVSIKVKLKSGDASYYLYTTDLSPKYVEINK